MKQGDRFYMAGETVVDDGEDNGLIVRVGTRGTILYVHEYEPEPELEVLLDGEREVRIILARHVKLLSIVDRLGEIGGGS